MYGIEFRRNTGNSLICAEAVFQLRKYNKPYREMRIRWHPDVGIAIDEDKGDGYVCIKERARPEDVEELLPQKQDFGFDWTYEYFLLAMTFFGEGYKLGQQDGYRSGVLIAGR